MITISSYLIDAKHYSDAVYKFKLGNIISLIIGVVAGILIYSALSSQWMHAFLPMNHTLQYVSSASFGMLVISVGSLANYYLTPHLRPLYKATRCEQFVEALAHYEFEKIEGSLLVDIHSLLQERSESEWKTLLNLIDVTCYQNQSPNSKPLRILRSAHPSKLKKYTSRDQDLISFSFYMRGDLRFLNSLT